MKSRFVFAGPIMLVMGLLLVLVMGSSHDVVTQDLSIEKADGLYVYKLNLKSGEDFSAQFTCHQSTGELRITMMTESAFNLWKNNPSLPSTMFVADAYGHQGKIGGPIQIDGAYYLIFSPIPATATWPFGVNVRLEFSSGGGAAGFVLGSVLLIGGAIVLIFGVRKKKLKKR